MMKWSKRALLAAMVAAPAAAAAQGAQLCQKLEGQIRNSEMNIASEFAEGVGDNSAPRAQMRELRAGNAWAQIQTMLTLMQMNNCPPVARVVSGTPYMLNALSCSTDRLRSSNPDSCNRKNWKPDPAITFD